MDSIQSSENKTLMASTNCINNACSQHVETGKLQQYFTITYSLRTSITQKAFSIESLYPLYRSIGQPVREQTSMNMKIT